MSPTEDPSYRFEFSHFPWIFSLQVQDPAPKDQPIRLEAKNISRTGMKFVTNRKIPLFEQVQVVLFEKGSGKEVTTLFGKVVRVEEVDTGLSEKTYGIGLEFLSSNAVLDRMIPEPEENEPKEV